MITITSKQDGFRRGGIAHSKQPTEYPDDFFDEERLAILEAEPMLQVKVATPAASKSRSRTRSKKEEGEQ